MLPACCLANFHRARKKRSPATWQWIWRGTSPLAWRICTCVITSVLVDGLQKSNTLHCDLAARNILVSTPAAFNCLPARLLIFISGAACGQIVCTEDR